MSPEYIPGQFADLIQQGGVTGSGAPVTGSTSTSSSGMGFILRELGDFILLESGDKIKLEA